eukprot:5152926-Amphidinium_carterae.3
MIYETIPSRTELTDQEFNYRSHTGSLQVQCEVLTDSWSLYLAGKPGNSKLPEEKSLLLVLAALRDHLKMSRIRRLGWRYERDGCQWTKQEYSAKGCADAHVQDCGA